MPDSSAADAWLIPLLQELLPASALKTVEDAPGDSVWAAAIDHGFITSSDLLAAVARRSRLEVARTLDVSWIARDALPEYLARRFHVVPLRIVAGALEIATASPYDVHAEQAIAFAVGRPVRILLALPDAIAERIESAYGSLLDDKSAPSAGEPDAAGEHVVRLVDRIVAQGIDDRASDIHLEPEENGVAVRYRIDGMLRHSMLLPRTIGVPLVSRVKIMAEMDIADRLRPQGGHASVGVDGSRVDLRVSTLPASHGEKVVIRILDPRAAVRSLESLGLDSHDAPRMGRLLEVREGLVLVTGPTGSGKTTTLYAALRHIQQRGLNIITVEDPVEYRIPGVVQVQINDKAGLTFATALRSILRQDPDVVLIGEIRDRETAAIAIQAALTGHLVFATLHTNDACSSITRLTDLGVDAAKLSAALKGIVAQRLIRKLCADCRIVANDGVPTQLRQSLPIDVMVHTTVGCDACAMTGYKGRVAVTEIVLPDFELERAIASGTPAEGLTRVVRRAGARSLWQSALSQLVCGNTTGDELLRVLDQQVTTAADAYPTGDGHGVRKNSSGRRDVQYDSRHVAVSESLDQRVSPPTVPVTSVIAGVVDVYVIRPLSQGWRVLVMQRGDDTRCSGAWETVHGRIEPNERPEHAAVREVREESGLVIARLYNVTVQPFYLHSLGTVQLAVVFAAFVDEPGTVTLGDEHKDYEWLPVDQALSRFAWPREREAIGHITQLLATGSAGPVEDVLRVF
ncbi:MAG: Flp pilus assembly complex ATPase component TadA [Gemmatimonadaceae bacterium]|nr:Flp pilus assembly complex ATPase component TadA [Gemmatimonadaceae bacterium]